MPRVRRLISAALVGVLSSACSANEPDGTQGPAVSVRDSLGVRITDNPEMAPDSALLSISPVPRLVIGNDESRSEEYLFGQIVAAARLSTGHIVVADGQAGDVRVFDSTGVFVRRIGRWGRGPGEFRGVGNLFLMGDTIVVRGAYDGEPVSLFTTDGILVRTWQPTVEASTGVPRLAGLWPDGSALVTIIRSRSPRLQAPTRLVPTVIEHSEQLIRVGPQGEVLADYGQHPTERYVFYNNHPRAGFEVTAPYLPQPRRTATSTGLYLTDGDPFEVRQYSLSGELVSIIRKAHIPADIHAGWGDSTWRATVSRLAQSEMGDWIGRVPPPPVPQHMPAIGSIVSDAQDNLWVSTPSLVADRPRTWFIFDSEGVLRHSVQTVISPEQIGADFVLTIRRDDIGVWTVALHDLLRPG